MFLVNNISHVESVTRNLLIKISPVVSVLALHVGRGVNLNDGNFLRFAGDRGDGALLLCILYYSSSIVYPTPNLYHT